MQDALNEEFEADHLFKRFHKHMDHLMPFHLPNQPWSFEAYLTLVIQDLSDFVGERAEIQSSPAKAST